MGTTNTIVLERTVSPLEEEHSEDMRYDAIVREVFLRPHSVSVELL